MEATEVIERKLGRFIPIKELKDWTEEKYVMFFRFCKFFTVLDEESGEHKWTYKKDTVAMVERLVTESQNPHYLELSTRINEINPSRYGMHLKNMSGSVAEFLKRNPAFITESIRKEIEGNKLFDHILWHYRNSGDDKGGSHIIPLVVSTKIGNKIKGREVDIVLMEAHLKMVDAYSQLTKLITVDEMRKMSIEDKLKYAKDLSTMVNNQKRFQPANVNVFIQNKESAEKLEASLLNYAQGEAKQPEEHEKV